MKILAVAIQKGGTGKTTTAACIAQAAAHHGKRVLAIDLDPQGNLSFALGEDISMDHGNSYNLLSGMPPEEQIQNTAQGIDLIPACGDLATASSGRGSARRLQDAIRPLVSIYDLIVIDTPPTAGELQYNALQAATGLVIPMQADIYNLQSLYQITDTARLIQKSNPALKILGCVITQCDTRSTIARQMQQAITDQAKTIGVPSLGTIRTGVVVKEAAALQQSLFEYAPKSNPAADYLSLYDTVMK